MRTMHDITRNGTEVMSDSATPYPILDTVFRIDGERNQCMITTNTLLIWDVHYTIYHTRGIEHDENYKMVWLRSVYTYGLNDMIPLIRGL